MSCLTSKETRKGLGNRVEGIHIYTHVQACFKMITLKHACTHMHIYTYMRESVDVSLRCSLRLVAISLFARCVRHCSTQQVCDIVWT
jgi:hypothetical protein